MLGLVGYNFLLFDAARAEINLNKALELNKLNRSLYKGSAEEDLAGIAPYLFTAKPNTDFANWYLTEGWNQSWGLLVNVTASFEDIYKHFRRFLMVKTEDDEQLYFRFYDPRVLRIFLPTCDKDQLKEFFGPIKSFVMEDEDPAFVLQMWLDNFTLKSRRTTFEEAFGVIAPIRDETADKAEQAEAEVATVENVQVEEKPFESVIEGNTIRENDQQEEIKGETEYKKKRRFF